MQLVTYVGHLQEHTTLSKLNLTLKRLLGMYDCSDISLAEIDAVGSILH